MDYNEIPVLKQCCFVLWNNHVFSIIQHWFSSLLHRLSQTFTNSVCTCFSGKQRHCIFLTPTGSHNLCLLICPGALGEAGCGPVLSQLTGQIPWIDLKSDSVAASPRTLHLCCPDPVQVLGAVLSQEGSPCLRGVHLWSWIISPDPVDPLPDGAHRKEGMQICSFLVKNKWKKIVVSLKNLKLHVG